MYYWPGEVVRSIQTTTTYNPFFQDDDALVTFFEKEMQECGDISHIKPYYDAVKDIVDKRSAGVGTVFECPPTITSNNWNENDWSKHLTAGLRQLFTSKSLDVEFSAEMGLKFRDLVFVSLRAPFDTHCFLFHGAPDILIHRNKAVFREESEDEIIENTHQRPILKGKDGCGPPQKLGEIITALHILLTAKVLRKIDKGRSLAGNMFSVKGLLLDTRVDDDDDDDDDGGRNGLSPGTMSGIVCT